MSKIENLERMLEKGPKTALLHFSLGNEYFNTGAYEQAAAQLDDAIALDPSFSAAWKIYGKALAALGRHREAIGILEKGITTAETKGDIQAAKEMKVFLKRSQKAIAE